MAPRVRCPMAIGKFKANERHIKGAPSVVSAGDPPTFGARRKEGDLAENRIAHSFFG